MKCQLRIAIGCSVLFAGCGGRGSVRDGFAFRAEQNPGSVVIADSASVDIADAVTVDLDEELAPLVPLGFVYEKTDLSLKIAAEFVCTRPFEFTDEVLSEYGVAREQISRSYEEKIGDVLFVDKDGVESAEVEVTSSGGRFDLPVTLRIPIGAETGDRQCAVRYLATPTVPQANLVGTSAPIAKGLPLLVKNLNVSNLQLDANMVGGARSILKTFLFRLRNSPCVGLATAGTYGNEAGQLTTFNDGADAILADLATATLKPSSNWEAWELAWALQFVTLVPSQREKAMGTGGMVEFMKRVLPRGWCQEIGDGATNDTATAAKLPVVRERLKSWTKSDSGSLFGIGLLWEIAPCIAAKIPATECPGNFNVATVFNFSDTDPTRKIAGEVSLSFANFDKFTCAASGQLDLYYGTDDFEANQPSKTVTFANVAKNSANAFYAFEFPVGTTNPTPIYIFPRCAFFLSQSGSLVHPVLLSLTDKHVASTLTVGPTLTFSETAPGKESTLELTVTNTGPQEVVFDEISTDSTLGLAAPFSYTSGTCSKATLAVNGTCTATLKFAPSAEGTTTQTFTLGVTNDQAASTVQASISGTSTIIPGTLSIVESAIQLIDNDTVAFGEVATSSSASKTFTLSAAANMVTLSTVSASAFGLSDLYSIDGASTCTTGKTLTTTTSCTVVVTVSPGETAGAKNSSMAIGWNDAKTNKSTTLQLTATAVSATGTLSLSVEGAPATAGSTITFDPVAIYQPSRKTIKLAASGRAVTLGTLTVEGLQLGTYFTVDGSSTCASAQTLADGAQCDLVLTFETDFHAGEYTSPLVVPWNDGAANTTTSLTLSGTSN